MLIILMKRSDYIEIKQTKKMGRGIFAKKDIPPNVKLMVIGQERFITYSKVKENPILCRLEEEIDCKITCFAYLLAHCAKNTQLSPEKTEIKEYIKELPEYFHNLICWDDEQLLLLECEELINKIRISKQMFLNKYTHIQQCLSNLLSKSKSLSQETISESQSKRSTRQRTTHFISHKENIDQQQISALLTISFEEVLKFIAVVKSRNIYWADQHDCHSEVGALIPYLELFNHSDNNQCKVELIHDCETVTTIKPIRKGQEIFVKYGENLAPELCLENYGMLPTPILTSSEDKENECCYQETSEEKQKGIRQERRELAARFKELRSEAKLPLLQAN